MQSANVTRVEQYLQAVASCVPLKQLLEFFTPDVVFQEFPNRIAPRGRVRRAADSSAAYEKSRQILQSQSYDVKQIIESGDEVAVELEWTGVLAIPMMNLPAGSVMKAFVAMFLTFRDGKIASQRNYDCYPPFDSDPPII
jgi:ketosteroid isomerase-like protein